MNGGILPFVLIAALAAMMIYAAWTDIRRREIDNGLNGAIALMAPLFWWSAGLPVWPDMALQILTGLIVLALFAILFAMGAMGGGDVKMIAALSLWLPLGLLMPMLFVMAIAGGVLTAAMLIRHRITKSQAELEIPYGVAIAAGGLWVSPELYFNQFT